MKTENEKNSLLFIHHKDDCKKTERDLQLKFGIKSEPLFNGTSFILNNDSKEESGAYLIPTHSFNRSLHFDEKESEILTVDSKIKKENFQVHSKTQMSKGTIKNAEDLKHKEKKISFKCPDDMKKEDYKIKLKIKSFLNEIANNNIIYLDENSPLKQKVPEDRPANDSTMSKEHSDEKIYSYSVKRKLFSQDKELTKQSNIDILQDALKKIKQSEAKSRELGVIRKLKTCYGLPGFKDTARRASIENYQSYHPSLLHHQTEPKRILQVKSQPKDIKTLKLDLSLTSHEQEALQNEENSPQEIQVCNTSNRSKSEDGDKRSLINLKNVYDSFSEEEIEVEEKDYRFIINPKSMWKRIWDLLIIVQIAYSVTIVPYRLSFEDELPDDNFQIFETFMDFVFIIDIVLNFLTPYNNKEEIMITNPKKVALNYIGGWFVIDLLSSIPTSFIYTFSEESSATNNRGIINLISLSRYSRLLKWVRVFRIAKLAKNDANGRLIQLIQLNYNSAVNRMLKYFFLLMVFLHISSCLWVFIAKTSQVPDNWISVYRFDDRDNASVYVSSVYFHLVTIFTIGYGDIVAKSMAEKIYNIFLLAFGVFLFSLTLSYLSSFFANLDKTLKIFRDKKELLEQIKEEYEVPDLLYSKLSKSIKIIYKRNNTERYELLEALPSFYKHQLLVIMNKTFIRDLKFFSNQNHDFILFVLPLLTPLIIYKGDVLFNIGQYVNEMYLVTKGTLGLYLNDMLDNFEVAQIGANSHFGEVLMYLDMQSPYTLKCKTESAHLLVLKKPDMSKIIVPFENQVLKLMRNSLEFLERVDKRIKLIKILRNLRFTEKEIKEKIKLINAYLLKKEFNDYYYNDKEFQDASEFVIDNFNNILLKKLLKSQLTEHDFEKYYNQSILLNKRDNKMQRPDFEQNTEQERNTTPKALPPLSPTKFTSMKDSLVTQMNKKKIQGEDNFKEEENLINEKLKKMANVTFYEQLPTIQEVEGADNLLEKNTINTQESVIQPRINHFSNDFHFITQDNKDTLSKMHYNNFVYTNPSNHISFKEKKHKSSNCLALRSFEGSSMQTRNTCKSSKMVNFKINNLMKNVKLSALSKEKFEGKKSSLQVIPKILSEEENFRKIPEKKKLKTSSILKTTKKNNEDLLVNQNEKIPINQETKLNDQQVEDMKLKEIPNNHNSASKKITRMSNKSISKEFLEDRHNIIIQPKIFQERIDQTQQLENINILTNTKQKQNFLDQRHFPININYFHTVKQNCFYHTFLNNMKIESVSSFLIESIRSHNIIQIEAVQTQHKEITIINNISFCISSATVEHTKIHLSKICGQTSCSNNSSPESKNHFVRQGTLSRGTNKLIQYFNTHKTKIDSSKEQLGSSHESDRTKLKKGYTSRKTKRKFHYKPLTEIYSKNDNFSKDQEKNSSKKYASSESEISSLSELSCESPSFREDNFAQRLSKGIKMNAFLLTNQNTLFKQLKKEIGKHELAEFAMKRLDKMYTKLIRYNLKKQY